MSEYRGKWTADCYRSLYAAGRPNNRIESDIFREELQSAFVRADVLISNQPPDYMLRSVYLDAVYRSASALTGRITEDFRQRLTSDFDAYVLARPDFYTRTLRAFEKEYGEPADHHLVSERLVAAYGITSVTTTVPSRRDAGVDYDGTGPTETSTVKRRFESPGRGCTDI